MMFLQDNSLDKEYTLSKTEQNLLWDYAGVPLKELQATHDPDLLVFPDKLEKYGDKWDKNDSLFNLIGGKIATGNVVGFFSIGPLQFQIGSRFDKKESSQFFLHYMLRRIMGMYMVKMPTDSSPEPIWDFIFYLFVYYLKRAVNQGIFRMYRTFERNDDHVCGAIDIPRHLRINTPFRGTIAYRSREHTGNNTLTQLIRHTIEVIRINPRASGLLSADEDIRTAVRTIMELTPDYNRHDLSKVVSKNLRPVRHPYYTEYAKLQTLCLKILRHERISYSESEDQIEGIIFKAEWLWEEYLATILSEADCNITHSQNNLNKSPIQIYVGKKVPKAYPDFYSNTLVLDAKYKTDSVKTEDRFQIISYLHILKSKAGILIYPNNNILETGMEYEGELEGFGGSIGLISFAVPQEEKDFNQFQKSIRKSEVRLIRIVCELNNQPAPPISQRQQVFVKG